MKSAICLIVDRLHAAYLGCYGNAWIQMPAFDRLAAQSFTCDQAIIDSPELERIYRGLWQAGHVLEPASWPLPAFVPALLRAHGVRTALVTDELQLLGIGSEAFDEKIHVPLPTSFVNSATVEETHLAALFARAIEWLASAREPFFLWIHASSLGTHWDAPLDLRNRYADEDEALPPPLVEVPRLVLPEDYDPDELLGYTQAYAGQVSLLDDCLGGCLEFIDEQSWARDALLGVVGARGIALGEHRRVGAWDSLHGELVQVPWLMRFPEGWGEAARSQALVQPCDLALTLAEWFELAPIAPGLAGSLLPLVRDEVTALRDRACLRGRSGERAIRTSAWFLRMAGEETVAGDDPAARAWLYSKPDDRFERNDVSRRCPHVVEGLERAWTDTAAAAAAGNLGGLPPLDENLLASHC